jgi:acyl-coenzyme A thioesterase PaaI-like protein
MQNLMNPPLAIETMRRNLAKAHASLHSRCVACGRENTDGLKLRFEVNARGQLETTFACRKCYEGFPHALHGGFTALLLDSAMTNCMFAYGLVCMTGELKVRFRHVVEIGKTVRVRAWRERSFHRLHILRACLEQEGEIRATASARFMEMPSEGQEKGEAGFRG